MFLQQTRQKLGRDSFLTCLSAPCYSAFAPAREAAKRRHEDSDRRQRRAPVRQSNAPPRQNSAPPRQNSAPSQQDWASSSPSSSSNTSEVKKYRSKHFDPTKAKKEDLPLLEPYVLSARLKKLCAENNTDAAINMLKSSPRDAQNAVVWNTVIWECMKSREYQKGYKLYVDMKRRGFSPTTRTFQTIFSGLSRIPDWSYYSKQLKNAESVYAAYVKHIDSVYKENPASPEISSAPLSLYFKILGEAGRYQDLFDIYYELDNKGPLKPDQLVYTAMLQSLSPLKIPYGQDTAKTAEQNASSAKHLWTQMLRESKRDTFVIDAHLVSAAIIALSKGRPADQEVAFAIARDYLAIPKPNSPGRTQLPPIAMNGPTLGAVLMLCRFSGKHQLCIDIFDEVKSRRRSEDLIDRGHVDEVFRARGAVEPSPPDAEYEITILDWMIVTDALRSGKRMDDPLRPLMPTFLLALTACWRTGDFRSAIRAFELMTGYYGHDFMDGVVKEKPRFDVRPAQNRNLRPSAENVSLVLRAAVNSKNRANMRQALRLIHYLDFDDLVYGPPEADGDVKKSKKQVKNILFNGDKLAKGVLEAVEHLLRNSTERDRPTPSDLAKWRQLRERAEDITQLAHKSRLISEKEVDEA